MVIFETSALESKCLALGLNMPCLGIFGLEFWRTIVIFETCTLKFVNNEFLTRTVNLSIGSAFSKSPVPDLVPLYKACHFSKNQKSLHLYEYHFQLYNSSFEKNSEKPPELTRHHDHRSWSMTARHTIV